VSYDPIDDFSHDGRRRLVDTRSEEIRVLLDLAFSSFVDEHPVGLCAFGFHEDDPVAGAVEWAMRRFVEADIDPGQLHPGSRSFRLFTEVRFWLCQKVGREGYDGIMAAAASPERTQSERDEAEEHAAALESTIDAFGRELAGVLSALRARTCADMVGYWLEGTRRLRRDWFGWRERGELSGMGAALSKKQRSFYVHDSMFRFLCCFHRLVPGAPDEARERALELTSLSPCENEPPYRVPDRTVVGHLEGFGVKGPREVARLRKEGARIFVVRCLDRAQTEALGAACDRMAAELTHRSLSPTTLHALGIEEDLALRERLKAEGRREEIS
jgi:hypothetical protein